jgi:hypothetical protein
MIAPLPNAQVPAFVDYQSGGYVQPMQQPGGMGNFIQVEPNQPNGMQQLFPQQVDIYGQMVNPAPMNAQQIYNMATGMPMAWGDPATSMMGGMAMGQLGMQGQGQMAMQGQMGMGIQSQGQQAYAQAYAQGQMGIGMGMGTQGQMGMMTQGQMGLMTQGQMGLMPLGMEDQSIADGGVTIATLPDSANLSSIVDVDANPIDPNNNFNAADYRAAGSQLDSLLDPVGDGNGGGELDAPDIHSPPPPDVDDDGDHDDVPDLGDDDDDGAAGLQIAETNAGHRAR